MKSKRKCIEKQSNEKNFKIQYRFCLWKTAICCSLRYSSKVHQSDRLHRGVYPNRALSQGYVPFCYQTLTRFSISQRLSMPGVGAWIHFLFRCPWFFQVGIRFRFSPAFPLRNEQLVSKIEYVLNESIFISWLKEYNFIPLCCLLFSAFLVVFLCFCCPCDFYLGQSVNKI